MARTGSPRASSRIDLFLFSRLWGRFGGRVTAFYEDVKDAGIRPLTAGGDHLTSLPVLRALGKDRSLSMIHFDSRTDLFNSYFGGAKYTHGTPFIPAGEEGLLDPQKIVQIGIRETAYDDEDRDFADAVGIRVIPIEEFHARGVDDVMTEACEIVGATELIFPMISILLTQLLRLAPARLRLTGQILIRRFRSFGTLTK